ncbi:MAG: sulfatase-like hydrolase/transferase [Pseudaminobacter sp.]|nr:sulfatase-like hydrolase/transferase [Pseudaminobacter sp.]
MTVFGGINRAIVSWQAIVLVCAAGALALLEMENEWFTMPFSLCVLMVFAALFFLFSRRIAFSLYSAWAVMGAITLVSLIKFREQGFDLHAYDIVFVGGDTSLYGFLLVNYLHLALPVLVLVGLALAGLAWVWAGEPARKTPLAARLLAPVALLGLLPVTIPATAAIDRHEYIVGGHHASAFFVSLLDLASLFTKSELEQRLAAIPAQAPFPDTVQCGSEKPRPDVFVVLSETQTPPFNFPQLGIPRDFADGFLSDDSKTRALRVETIGGGTWISNFSLMTGLSAGDFGWQRPYLTIALENKIQGALPEVLARCGYRTAVIASVDSSFVNEGRFLRSIGFETVLDANDIGAGDERRRDSFYYAAAEQLIEEHRRTDKRPLFLQIQTMFPHSPHNVRLEPELAVPGEPLNPDDQINEYLRRVHIARQDFGAFLDSRRADPAGRGSVVLEFGDHQSSVTMPMVEELEGHGSHADPDSLAYVTHFSTHAFGYAFEESMPQFDRLDIAFLGATFARAAGLPTSPLMDDLIRLRDVCEGRFHSCRDRATVDRHLKRRVDSGLLDIMDKTPGS